MVSLLTLVDAAARGMLLALLLLLAAVLWRDRRAPHDGPALRTHGRCDHGGLATRQPF